MMNNVAMMAVKAQLQAKAAGEQHEVANAIPHGFRASDESRIAYRREVDAERGMWGSQRRSAAAATAMFLREHGCSTTTGKTRRTR